MQLLATRLSAILLCCSAAAVLEARGDQQEEEAAAACSSGGEEEEVSALQLRHGPPGAVEAAVADEFWPTPPRVPHSNAVGVFVMMELTMVTLDGDLRDPDSLKASLRTLKENGAAGIMTDVWWGITEKEPKSYDFSAYKQLVGMCEELGLKAQLITSFHQCCAEGDECYIPLPAFLRTQDGIWYKNGADEETRAYVSLFADKAKVGSGPMARTPYRMYRDWLKAFGGAFRRDLGRTISDVFIGLGTDGELKYPSYEIGVWNYPGIGMPTAFDAYALRSLRQAAAAANMPASWGEPPSLAETGNTSALPEDTTFYAEGGGYQTPKGKFFLEWYTNALLRHAQQILSLATSLRWIAPQGLKLRISGKMAGVHWWYKHPSHAAEVNAGYYNTNGVNGYGRFARLFRRLGASLDFTCLEMVDNQPQYDSGPQELVMQVMQASREAGVVFTGENALGFYDAGGYNQMLVWKPPTGSVASLAYLRLGKDLLEKANLAVFRQFCEKMADPGYVTPFQVS